MLALTPNVIWKVRFLEEARSSGCGRAGVKTQNNFVAKNIDLLKRPLFNFLDVGMGAPRSNFPQICLLTQAFFHARRFGVPNWHFVDTCRQLLATIAGNAGWCVAEPVACCVPDLEMHSWPQA